MKRVHISWAKKNGFETGYNKPVTKDMDDRCCVENKTIKTLPVAICPECNRAFDTKMTNGKANGRNKLLRPSYLPDWFDSTLGLRKELCGGDKCHNKKPKKEIN